MSGDVNDEQNCQSEGNDGKRYVTHNGRGSSSESWKNPHRAAGGSELHKIGNEWRPKCEWGIVATEQDTSLSHNHFCSAELLHKVELKA